MTERVSASRATACSRSLLLLATTLLCAGVSHADPDPNANPEPSADPSASAQAAPVDALGWMAGRWEAVDGERWTEEYWAAPRGGVLIGFSRAGRGDALREFEYLRIEPGADGAPVYLAQPGGRPAVAFRLTAGDAMSATFANPAHDFPQRIVYRRDGETIAYGPAPSVPPQGAGQAAAAE